MQKNLLLNFSAFPQDGLVFDFKYEEIKTLLSLMIDFSLRYLVETKEITLKENVLYKPFNVFITRSSESLVFGLSNEKAMISSNILTPTKHEFPSDVCIDNLKDIAEEELGIKLNTFFYFDYNILLENRPFLEKNIFTSEIDISTIPENLFSNISKNILLFKYQIIERRKQMLINPIFKTKNITIDQNLCFSLLPFTKDLMDIFDQIITPTIKEEFNMQVLRANDITGTSEIMEDIWTYICKARFLIADISGKNPNVYYELGICHTLGKEVITICEEESYEHDYKRRLPFDIAHRRVILYKNTGPGMIQFQKQLINTIQSVLGASQIE